MRGVILGNFLSAVIGICLFLQLAPVHAQIEGNDPLGGEPLKNFHQVEGGLYRSAQPTTYRILRQLAAVGFKTVVDLRQPHEKRIAEGEYLTRLGVKYYGIPLSNVFNNKLSDLTKIRDILGDQKNWPLLVHCKAGKDRTGITVGLYRIKYSGWTPEQAYQEMQSFNFTPYRPHRKAWRALTGHDPFEILIEDLFLNELVAVE